MDIVQSLKKYKWVVVLVVLAGFLFYWFEIRPVRITRGCVNLASVDARKLLRSKADISKGTEKGKVYETLIQKNMYLRSDFESFLQKCLLHYGMLPPSMTNQAATSSAAAAATN